MRINIAWKVNHTQRKIIDIRITLLEVCVTVYFPAPKTNDYIQSFLPLLIHPLSCLDS